MVGVTGYSLASQALPACCHLAWHQADNFAPLGYGTIHRIVPLNAPCPLRVQVPLDVLNKKITTPFGMVIFVGARGGT